jgi:hypothetical protein
MTTTRPFHLEPLSLIPVSTVSQGRRTELASRQHDRKDALHEGIGLLSLGSASAVSALAYLCGALFLLLSGEVVLGTMSMLVYAVIGFVSCFMYDGAYRKFLERRRLAVAEQLMIEAEAEQALADVVDRLNADAAAWNECRRIVADGELEGFDEVLIDMGTRIYARFRGFEARLGRHLIAITSARRNDPSDSS